MIQAIQKNQFLQQPKFEDEKKHQTEQNRNSVLNEFSSQTQLLELEQMYQTQLEQARQETYDLQKEYRQKFLAKENQIKELQIKIESLLIEH